HALYYLEWLLGPMRRLTARLVTDQIGAESGADLWLESRGGVPVSVSIAANAFSATGHRLEIYGSEGSLVLENTTADYVQGFTLRITRREGAPAAEEKQTGHTIRDGRVMAVGAIVRRFVDAIVADGGSKVTPNLSDGLRVQRLLDAA